MCVCVCGGGCWGEETQQISSSVSYSSSVPSDVSLFQTLEDKLWTKTGISSPRVHDRLRSKVVLKKNANFCVQVCFPEKRIHSCYHLKKIHKSEKDEYCMIIAYMDNLKKIKKDTNELTYKTETDSQDLENSLTVGYQGRRVREGRLVRFGLTRSYCCI